MPERPLDKPSFGQEEARSDAPATPDQLQKVLSTLYNFKMQVGGLERDKQKADEQKVQLEDDQAADDLIKGL